MKNSVKRLNLSRSVFESCVFASDFMPTESLREEGQYEEGLLGTRLSTNAVVVFSSSFYPFRIS